MLFVSVRGGSTMEENAEDEADGDDHVDEEELESDDEGEDEDEEITSKAEKSPSIVSKKPVQLFFSTNWGNSVVDQTVELKSQRTKTVANLKKSLSKQLPGRPPILALELVYEGRILDDETIVEELFEDEEDEEDDHDEDHEPRRELTLNIVPPVDPKFAIELGPKLMFQSEENDDNFFTDSGANTESLTTDELIDAYYLNQVAMSRNAHLLADPNFISTPHMRFELQDQARHLRDQLSSQTPTDVWQKSMQDFTQKSGHNKGEWRGERYRSGKGGVMTQFKTTIQTNLNVNWADAIKNFLLLLFFGYFGGRNSFSRKILLLGAPLSFALQARPVKICFKALFYMLSNPPSILLSFLPAPQQAILSVDLRASCVALYGEDGAKKILVAAGKEFDNDSTTTISGNHDSEEEGSDYETDDEEESDYGTDGDQEPNFDTNEEEEDNFCGEEDEEA